MHPTEEKSLLRQSIKDRMAHLSDDQRHAESRTICRQIKKSLPSQPVPIAAYFPLKDEADLRPLLDELLKEGWPIFIPGIEHGQMIFRKITSTADLHLGKFGVLEPPRDAELMDPQTLKIVLVPGRAFDVLGNRLGRGNSTYDKWITAQRHQNPLTRFWGIALECQIVHHVPMQEHDERMDSIVSARVRRRSLRSGPRFIEAHRILILIPGFDTRCIPTDRQAEYFAHALPTFRAVEKKYHSIQFRTHFLLICLGKIQEQLILLIAHDSASDGCRIHPKICRWSTCFFCRFRSDKPIMFCKA